MEYNQNVALGLYAASKALRGKAKTIAHMAWIEQIERARMNAGRLGRTENGAPSIIRVCVAWHWVGKCQQINVNGNITITIEGEHSTINVTPRHDYHAHISMCVYVYTVRNWCKKEIQKIYEL